jgi:hypothetical protein
MADTTRPVYAYSRPDFDFEVWPDTIVVRSRAVPGDPLTVVYPFSLITRVFPDAQGRVMIQLLDGVEIEYRLEPGAAAAACAAFWKLA